MITVKVTRSQYRVLQNLTRKEVGTLKKYPTILSESRELLRACKKVIKKVGEIPEHANKRKRQTAYKRIISICQKAIDRKRPRNTYRRFYLGSPSRLEIDDVTQQ